MKGNCVWAAALLWAAACGDEEKGESAPERCQKLINSFCDRATQCAVDDDILSSDYPASELKSDCKDVIGDVLPCDDADSIDDGYVQCLSDVKNFSCDTSNAALLDDMAFASPPASCDDVIVFIR